MGFFGKDYDSVQVAGEFKALPAGGYVCRIVQAKAAVNNEGLPMVEAAIDIIDGEYTQYFSKLFRDRMMRDPNAKYPYNGVLRITAVDKDGRTKKLFKGFCTAVEDSNEMKLPRTDDAFIKALNGKEIGVIFGREQYEGYDGNVRWSTKPRWFRDVKTIMSGDYTVPEDQYLSNTGFSRNSGSNMSQTGVDSFSAASDDIPF